MAGHRNRRALAWCLTLVATLAVLATATGSAARPHDVVSLRSVNYPDRYVRHRNFLVELNPIGPSDRADATFRMVRGLDGGDTVSFEAVNFPGYYLRHQNFVLKLQRDDGSALFRKDASFHEEDGLADRRARSFEASNFPGYYIRHSNFFLRLDRDDRSELFANDASFFVADGFERPRARRGMCFWLQAGPNGRWQPMPQIGSKRGCFEMDSCDGGMGRSGGGCYKWAEGPDAPRRPWNGRDDDDE